MNNSILDWIEIIIENDIINRLNSGEAYKSIVVDLNRKGNYCTEDSLRKAIYRQLEYKKSKSQNLLYREEQKESIYIMNNVDIEFEIENISRHRYYDRYKNSYPECIGEEQVEMINLHKGIYEDLEKVSELYGADSPEELIELLLLRFLEKEDNKDLTNKFREKYFLDENYDEKEIKILMKYNDEDDTPAYCDELFWENEECREVEDLKELYINELKKINIEVFKTDGFSDLKYKYDKHFKILNSMIY